MVTKQARPPGLAPVAREARQLEAWGFAVLWGDLGIGLLVLLAGSLLVPALSLRSYVAAVKAVAPGESVGYGRRFVASEETYVATIPIGYGDGVRRGLGNNGEVSIGGERYPIVGTVSMDNLTVDVGDEPVVAVGDEVVLIGDGLLAEEVARRLDTINYEVTCGLSARVPREQV